ncbi:MAG: hypothetical protein A2086_02390 [Spirochaetes bacterium GWD1_27_9]|nr:MAG: hypothetical protein A2Z98_08255 [Spirochaetes bacterium GWB1_27_13]OHD27762.1 MAG: hypothetical protein A2Y34_08985 [Spirochaetes bacterium GWC1_27_15]OHD31579.1 MAG: hypothetical protein A2086_02390 [Spirochaetes bacterium GWD1_27_9]
MGNLELCILQTEEELIEFEKGLYEEFVEKEPNSWIVKNYEHIDGCRLKSTIPYEYQKIYAVKKDGKIIMAAALNMNNKIRLKIEEMGFTLTEEQKNINFCEGLSLYIVKDCKENPFDLDISLKKFYMEDLKKLGKTAIYGVCADKLLKLYLKFNFKILIKTFSEEENEYQYLLRYDIPQ